MYLFVIEYTDKSKYRKFFPSKKEGIAFVINEGDHVVDYEIYEEDLELDRDLLRV